jgi:hypothetical protein
MFTRIIHQLVGRNKQTHTVPELRPLFAAQRVHQVGDSTRGVCVVPANELRDLVPAYVNNSGFILASMVRTTTAVQTFPPVFFLVVDGFEEEDV